MDLGHIKKRASTLPLPLCACKCIQNMAADASSSSSIVGADEWQTLLLCQIVFINGVCDMACAASHLLGSQNFLTSMHVDMFDRRGNGGELASAAGLQQRMLAYWIFTYGVVRCMVVAAFSSKKGGAAAAGIVGSPEVLLVVASSYLVEGLAYGLEGFVYRTADVRKVAWLAGTSFTLGLALLLLFCCSNC